jgi:hypothetical protein
MGISAPQLRSAVADPERTTTAMPSRSKLFLAGFGASLLMGFAVSSASAGRISTSNTRFRVSWASLNLEAFENEARVRCALTLEGSFHSATVRKVRGALIGAVTRSTIKGESCEGGRATILQESLPWHLTWESFSGTLPRIEEVTFLIRRYEFRMEVTVLGFRIACLYLDQGRPEENLAGSVRVDTATGQVTTETPLTDRYAGFRIGSELCPRRARFEGAGQVFLLGSSTTRITITLI